MEIDRAMNLDTEIAYREAIGQVLQTMTMKTGDIPRDHEMQPDFGRDYRVETDREMKNRHKTDNIEIGTDTETPLDHKTTNKY